MLAKARRFSWALCILGLMLLTSSPAIPLFAQDAGPVKVAILPFAMNAPDDLDYLQDGIRDMLASRINWEGRVQVVDANLTRQAMKGAPSKLTADRAAAIGKTLDADYVLFGSLTALGQSISIDAAMAATDGKRDPVSLYVQTQSMDEVIPKINQFAREINGKVFGRQTSAARMDSSEEGLGNRSPEFLIPDTMTGGERISYLNPNFIEVTPREAMRRTGLWRSQTFNEGYVGMDVGDLDGDGRLELVAASGDKIRVYLRQANALKNIATYEGTKLDRFVWVSVVDVDRDGRDEIFVTNMRTRNNPGGNTSDRISYGRDAVEKVASFGLSFADGQFRVLCEYQPYFLNGVVLPRRGKVLVGQQPGTRETFDPEIQELQLKGGNLQVLNPVSLLSRCNVYNFALADLNNDKTEDTILIDDNNRLLVYGGGEGMRWKARKRFGATSNRIVGKVEDLRYNQVDYFYIPSPILVTDLNKDGIAEVVVNRSPDYSGFLPQGFKYYEYGEIVSLSWNQLGMAENWKTREVDGMVTSLRLGDLDGDGTEELIVSLVMGKDLLKIWETNSAIFTYDLNLSPQTARRP